MPRTMLLALMLISTNMSGCIFDNSNENQFEWPDRSESLCEILHSANELVCTEYLSGFETPILSQQHPVEDEIWIVDLNGCGLER